MSFRRRLVVNARIDSYILLWRTKQINGNIFTRLSRLLRARCDKDLQVLPVARCVSRICVRQVAEAGPLKRAPHRRLVEAMPMGDHRVALVVDHRVRRCLVLERHQVRDEQHAARGKERHKYV
jgi:hypothetical protein